MLHIPVKCVDVSPRLDRSGVDYGLDLKNFHEGSHNASIVPMLIATERPSARRFAFALILTRFSGPLLSILRASEVRSNQRFASATAQLSMRRFSRARRTIRRRRLLKLPVLSTRSIR